MNPQAQTQRRPVAQWLPAAVTHAEAAEQVDRARRSLEAAPPSARVSARLALALRRRRLRELAQDLDGEQAAHVAESVIDDAATRVHPDPDERARLVLERTQEIVQEVAVQLERPTLVVAGHAPRAPRDVPALACWLDDARIRAHLEHSVRHELPGHCPR
ncbi:hypothetical protein KIN34_03660 [Cellulomonas sp. DKR-3]|uniref:Uncharacterized protein n=1 Tax=Cellulomonas fulva TaxID=2835530 RepID=A0ABS5TW95_9CELL|nr:hypothetical protein [Cellulomonas fulva]MBT0993381.1 hypothetical protein [Cellulomonas fulva]